MTSLSTFKGPYRAEGISVLDARSNLICAANGDGYAEALASRLNEADEMEADKRRIDWLNESVTDTIYLDDGRIIDVRGGDVRSAIDARRVRGPRHRPESSP